MMSEALPPQNSAVFSGLEACGLNINWRPAVPRPGFVVLGGQTSPSRLRREVVATSTFGIPGAGRPTTSGVLADDGKCTGVAASGFTMLLGILAVFSHRSGARRRSAGASFRNGRVGRVASKAKLNLHGYEYVPHVKPKPPKPAMFRMPLPEDVDEIKPPTWPVLMEAVRLCEAKDAVIPTWKLKPKLGIHSPTPQYAPLALPVNKPFWCKSNFIRRRQKKFYNKMRELRMEQEDYRLRYLPDPKDRLVNAGTQLLVGRGVFKAEAESWKTLRKMSTDDLVKAMNTQRTLRLGNAGKTIPINWRPHYQQFAIKKLKPTLERVDVIVEVRDARIPWTSRHPDMPEWTRGKPRVIVLTKADLVPPVALEQTIVAIKNSKVDRGCPVIPMDAQRGSIGVEDLRIEVMKSGAHVNRKRKRKGVNPRAIRAAITGMPNVGKSAIINCLTGRKVALKNGVAGGTKKLTWHKIGGFRNTEIEFLDTPGLIPLFFGKRFTEQQANMMCMCRMFGERIIDREQTAHELIHHIAKLARDHPQFVERTVWRETERIYKIDFQAAVRREAPFLPDSVPTRNPEPYCGKILNDFNKGYWGRIQLEPPPAEVLAEMEDYKRGIQATMEEKPTEEKKTVLLLPPEKIKTKLFQGKPREMMPVMAMPTASRAKDHFRELLPPTKRMEPMHVPVGGGFDQQALFDGW